MTLAADVCERCGCALSMARDARLARRRRGRWLCRPCGQSESGSVTPDWSSLVAVDGEPRSLREIAAQLGVTVEAVRHVEQRALARLRVRLEALGLEAREVLAYLDGLVVGRESCEPSPDDEPECRRKAIAARETAVKQATGDRGRSKVVRPAKARETGRETRGMGNEG